MTATLIVTPLSTACRNVSGSGLFFILKQLQVDPQSRPVPTPEQFRLEQVYVGPRSELAGETLAGGRIRQRFGVTVIGIQRGDERIANPAPDFLIVAGDVLMVAGLPEKIDAFASQCDEKPLPAVP